MKQPLLLDSIAALRQWREAERRSGRSIGLVPTMGALHAGHISLVTTMRERVDSTVISIFVNPAQFAPHEDFSKYPRTLASDMAQVSAAGGDAVYAPGVADIYPEGFVTTISLEGPARVGLEDASRPTHFAGVATVVAKLLAQVMPDRAIFGEKDFQQLAVIRRLVRDLDIPVEILAGATQRDADGLALSSRNVYLTPEERRLAPSIHHVLTQAAGSIRTGIGFAQAELVAREALEAIGFAVDYVAIRDSQRLTMPATDAAPDSLRILCAARLGSTRLLDNIAV